MTDSVCHISDLLQEQSLAELQDLYDAQHQLARCGAFASMCSADKLYYLMVCVRKPVSFGDLLKIALLNGISEIELCRILADYPRYFFEIADNHWATTHYAETSGYIPHPDYPHSVQRDASPVQDVDSMLTLRKRRPVKNGITCLSPDEVNAAALQFLQNCKTRIVRSNNLSVLSDFIELLALPVRARELNDAAIKILGFKSESSLRKYLSTKRSLFCSPAHGVWISSRRASELGYRDYRL